MRDRSSAPASAPAPPRSSRVLAALSRRGGPVGPRLQIHAPAGPRGGRVAQPAAVPELPGSRPRRPGSGLLPRLKVFSQIKAGSKDIKEKSLFFSPPGCPSVLVLSFLLVTAGEDRYVKTWDLRRLYSPVTAFKRFLTNEIYWPLNAPGIMMAQDNVYTTSVKGMAWSALIWEGGSSKAQRVLTFVSGSHPTASITLTSTFAPTSQFRGQGPCG